jgi:short-subunit dehydrogenase
MSNAKTVLITGATAGIGRITALHLAMLGHHVIATGRKAAELATLRAEAEVELSKLATDRSGGGTSLCARPAPGKIDTMLLDVTSLASITAAAQAVDELTGGRGVDVLVNNAGFGVLGPTSEIGDDEMRRQYDTNVFGLMNVTRAFLPKMMERRAGRVINISSLGGRVTLPYFGVYNSTKFAVESLSDALRYELRPFGIDVVLIEPGVIRTNFEATATSNLGGLAHTPYHAALGKYEQLSKLANRFASDPIVVAKAIGRAVNARRPSARYIAPLSNTFVILFARVFPTRMWDWAMRKVAFLSEKSLSVPPSAAQPHDMSRAQSKSTETRASMN